MVKTRITDRGIICEPGDGMVIETQGNTYNSPVRPSTQTLSANATLTAENAGMLVITSSTGGAKTITFPPVAGCGGLMFVIRNASADAHILTGTSTDQSRVFSGQFGNGVGGGTTGHGSRLTMPAVIGTSVVLMGDGLHFVVCGTSGTMTLAGN